MISRLETDEAQRRTLLADISHELRTPLTVVQGNLEAIVDGVYPPDPAHLAVVLDETQGPRPADRRPPDPGPVRGGDARPPSPSRPIPDVLVGDVVRSFEPAAAAAGVDDRGGDRRRPADRRGRPGPDPRGARRTWSPTPSATRRPAAGSRSPGRSRTAAGYASRSATRAAASTRHCWRTSSTGSPRATIRPAPGSASRSRASSWSPTAARSAPTHRPGRRPAAGPRSGPAAAYGRVTRTSSTAASTVLARPRSAAAKTMRIV